MSNMLTIDQLLLLETSVFLRYCKSEGMCSKFAAKLYEVFLLLQAETPSHAAHTTPLDSQGASRFAPAPSAAHPSRPHGHAKASHTSINGSTPHPAGPQPESKPPHPGPTNLPQLLGPGHCSRDAKAATTNDGADFFADPPLQSGGEGGAGDGPIGGQEIASQQAENVWGDDGRVAQFQLPDLGGTGADAQLHGAGGNVSPFTAMSLKAPSEWRHDEVMHFLSLSLQHGRIVLSTCVH